MNVQWPPSPKRCDQNKRLRKMENQQFVSSSRHCFSTLVGFGQEFLYREQFDDTGESPWLGSSYFYLFPRLKSTLKGRRFFLNYWHYSECDGRAEKAFTKWLPGKFSTPLQLLVEVCICQKRLLRMTRSLNDCTVLYLSQVKWFREKFEATTYMGRMRSLYNLFLVLETEKLNLP
jgi:hypothetical protein